MNRLTMGKGPGRAGRAFAMLLAAAMLLASSIVLTGAVSADGFLVSGTVARSSVETGALSIDLTSQAAPVYVAYVVVDSSDASPPELGPDMLESPSTLTGTVPAGDAQWSVDLTGLTPTSESVLVMASLDPGFDDYKSLTLDVPEPLSAPLELTAVPGDGQALLSWAAPESDGGLEIEGYQLTKDGWVTFEPTTAMSHTFTGLTNGVEYTFLVRAVNSAGPGPEASISATPAVPVVAEFASDVSSGSAPLAVQFTDASTGATSWSWDFDDGATSSLQNPSHTFTAQGTYNVTLTASGPGGSDTARHEVTVTSSSSAPSAPIGLSASSGDRSVTLSWSAPSSDGGSAITGYQYRMDSGTWANVPSGTSIVIPNLVDGVQHTFYVRAVNVAGEGATASVTAAGGSVPPAPVGLLATPDDGSVTLSWEPPSGGPAVTGYQVTMDDWATSESTASLSHTFTGLVNGQSYAFQVRAVNAIGHGASATVTATPQIASIAFEYDRAFDSNQGSSQYSDVTVPLGPGMSVASAEFDGHPLSVNVHYQVSGGQIVMPKQALTDLVDTYGAGEYTVVFTTGSDSSITVSLTMSRTAYQRADVFDANPAYPGYADVIVPMPANPANPSSSLKALSVSVDGRTLSPIYYLQLSNGSVSVSKEYLKTLSPGYHDITFNMISGPDVELRLRVMLEYPVLEEPGAYDGSADLTLRVDASAGAGDFSGLYLAGVLLTPGTDYQASGSTFTLLKSGPVLSGLWDGTHSLVAEYSDGRAQADVVVRKSGGSQTDIEYPVIMAPAPYNGNSDIHVKIDVAVGQGDLVAVRLDGRALTAGPDYISNTLNSQFVLKKGGPVISGLADGTYQLEIEYSDGMALTELRVGAGGSANNDVAYPVSQPPGVFDGSAEARIGVDVSAGDGKFIDLYLDGVLLTIGTDYTTDTAYSTFYLKKDGPKLSALDNGVHQIVVRYSDGSAQTDLVISRSGGTPADDWVTYAILQSPDAFDGTTEVHVKIDVSSGKGRFSGLYIDGQRLTAGEDYVASDNSVFVLKKDGPVISKLEIGTHALLVQYSDGQAEMDLVIAEPKPATYFGLSLQMLLAAIAAIAIACALAVFLVVMSRRRRERARQAQMARSMRAQAKMRKSGKK